MNFDSMSNQAIRNEIRNLISFTNNIKHIRRTGGKSILTILLSALLFGAVGQFEAMHQSYIDLCNSAEIKATFINGLPLSTVTKIMKTGYVINPYYEYTHDVDFNYSKVDWVVTNDIAGYTGEEIDITYAEGYDESCMKVFGRVCIVGDKLLEESGFKLGDKVYVTLFRNLKESAVDLY